MVHTNGMENYWSLTKRALHGTYVSVEPFHLFRYLDEQAFRYNNRTDKTNADRFSIALIADRGKAASVQGTHRTGGGVILGLCGALCGDVLVSLML
jgi:ISXO2-like transposase domain